MEEKGLPTAREKIPPGSERKRAIPKGKRLLLFLHD